LTRIGCPVLRGPVKSLEILAHQTLSALAVRIDFTRIWLRSAVGADDPLDAPGRAPTTFNLGETNPNLVPSHRAEFMALGLDRGTLGPRTRLRVALTVGRDRPPY